MKAILTQIVRNDRWAGDNPWYELPWMDPLTDGHNVWYWTGHPAKLNYSWVEVIGEEK